MTKISSIAFFLWKLVFINRKVLNYIMKEVFLFLLYNTGLNNTSYILKYYEYKTIYKFLLQLIIIN